MRDVHVAGASSTHFGRFLNRSLRSLAEEAVDGALRDAGGTPDGVDAVFFANAAAGLITGQEMIRGQVALRDTGLLGLPIVNVENACASGSTALHLAWLSVASGASDVTIAIGAEKLSHEDKTRSFAAFGGAVDQGELSNGDGPPQRSLFMDIYAAKTRDYMARTGATSEHFARIAVKSHANAALNESAQFRDPVTVEQVLASRTISDPLTLLMCSPIGDGASALVLSSDEGLERLDADPVRVLATVLLSGRARQPADVITRAATRAYAMAGIRPQDVDVVELHDAAAPAELFAVEELGLCEPDGGGLELLTSGGSEIGGRLPLNPSGGLLSKGHPIGATGCSQVAEVVDQLRGRCGARQVEGARIGMAENGGGFLGGDAAAATITLLAR
jgi:acetyl-CoA acyltransferase